MTHDPLCTTIRNTEMNEAFCDCELIARVREDERQQAHNVIDRFDMFSDDRDAMHAWINGTPPKWWTETSNEKN